MMYCALFLFLCLGLANAKHTPRETKMLANMILKSGAFPSVTNHSAALRLASLLEVEFENYASEVGQLKGDLGANEFNCPVTGRTEPRPTNAQQLKPGDIDVVATIGDSVAAAFGALSESIFTVFTEYRGYSFANGGETNFEDFVTVPNILKKYNPNIKGFSVGNGGHDSSSAVFNAAVSGARSYDLLGQLSFLKNRMIADGVDLNNDWKLLSIFVGGNDLCDFCGDVHTHSAANYSSNIEGALDYVKDNFPRVFINVISPPDVTLLSEVSSGLCSFLHAFECGCNDDQGTKIAHGEYIAALATLVKSPKYHDKLDFHVSFQPFLSKLDLPRNPDGTPDRTYFAPDCFHFAGKAHQAAAVALWNNMAELTDKKETWVPGEPIECPVDYLA